MENWPIPDPAQGPIENFRVVREMLKERIAGLRRDLGTNIAIAGNG